MDDDLFHPTKIEKMVEVYRTNPDVSLVTSARNFIDADGNIIGNTQNLFGQDVKIPGEEAGRMLFPYNNYIGEPTTVLIRKKFLRDNDLCWNEDETGFFSLVDMSTWLQLLTQGNMVRLIECLSLFRQHENQMTYDSKSWTITPAAHVKLFRDAWERKIFVTTEQDFLTMTASLLRLCSERLSTLYANGRRDEECAKILEKFCLALSQALSNGYKIELPTVDYSV